ncbi:hypothetical protein EYF80_056480 [Liparis tanakae]|uniref:Uncharacterized protein n=1 Tax=Liparis tanakae TaxID=230148 RepID=A0A4Z2EYR9_9TELE|nr:hypothetical protein EYF80_056480 [Liparis tanakae]
MEENFFLKSGLRVWTKERQSVRNPESSSRWREAAKEKTHGLSQSLSLQSQHPLHLVHAAQQQQQQQQQQAVRASTARRRRGEAPGGLLSGGQTAQGPRVTAPLRPSCGDTREAHTGSGGGSLTFRTSCSCFSTEWTSSLSSQLNSSSCKHTAQGGFRAAGLQGCRAAGLQGCRAAGLQAATPPCSATGPRGHAHREVLLMCSTGGMPSTRHTWLQLQPDNTACIT